MNELLLKFRNYKDYAPLFIRVLAGVRLIYGTQDNILSWQQMLEFRDFLSGFGFPLPLASAVLSVYAQFICGLMFILGFKVHWAAAVMIVNFTVALLTIHIADTFIGSFQALTMLFCSFFLLLNGPGKASVGSK